MCWNNDHIRQTALKHKNITKCVPVVHALTGCDTVSCMFDIGKATALKELMGGHHLIELGQQGQIKTSWHLRQLASLLPVMYPELKKI